MKFRIIYNGNEYRSQVKSFLFWCDIYTLIRRHPISEERYIRCEPYLEYRFRTILEARGAIADYINISKRKQTKKKWEVIEYAQNIFDENTRSVFYPVTDEPNPFLHKEK